MRSGSPAYIPGQYRPDGKRDLSEESGHFARMLQVRRPQTQRSATIHFSRKIGSGALEIAHLLAPRIGYTVIDRQILEHIARDAQLGDPAPERKNSPQRIEKNGQRTASIFSTGFRQAPGRPVGIRHGHQL